MSFKIGFASDSMNETPAEEKVTVPQAETEPRRSVVQVYFPARDMNLAYYNDRFDLKRGDMVYVDGKLEGLRGRVTSVNYNFKIKLSAYQRVIAKIDTDIHGKFSLLGSHFVTFDRNALSADRVITWFRAPLAEDEEFVSGSDGTAFSLDDLQEMNADGKIFERAHKYYMEDKVRYLCIDGTKGYAIVEGSEAYEVEFEYENRVIRNITCSCYCSYPCKHEVAAMFQLRESLDRIEKDYADEFEKTGYFAVISKGAFFSYVIDTRETGAFEI